MEMSKDEQEIIDKLNDENMVITDLLDENGNNQEIVSNQDTTSNSMNNIECDELVPSPRSKQRQFVSGKLKNLKTLGPKIYSEIMIQPILQYFVASLSDLKIREDKRKPIGLRFSEAPEVQCLIKHLTNTQIQKQQIVDADPNAIIAVLKQLLTDFPGGIFDDLNEEFLSVGLNSPLEIGLAYVNGLVSALPVFLKQFTFLVCKSLRNLAQQSSGSLIDSYTDLLLLFTPILFPNSVDDVSRFLRATRITLILVDMCDQVFRPFLDNSALTDSAYHSDEDFFADVLNTLNQLQDSFHVTKDGDSGNEDEFWLDPEEINTSRIRGTIPNNTSNEYYQITYMEDM